MLYLKEVLKLDGKLLSEARALRYLLDAIDDLAVAEGSLLKDCANTKNMFRIIQSIPSPKALIHLLVNN